MVQIQSLEQDNGTLRESIGAHQGLIEQYEHRFSSLREVIEERERESEGKIGELGLILEDQRLKIEKLQRANGELEVERGTLMVELKDAKWSLDQHAKRAQREIQRIKDQWEDDASEKEKLIERVKAEAHHLL